MSFSSDNPLQANQLPISIQYPSPTDPNFVDVLSLDRKRISDSVNTKVGGLYQIEEVASFKQVFSPDDPQRLRNVYRMTFDLVSLNGGVIAPGAMAPQPHGLTNIVSTLQLYVGCTNTVPQYFEVVYPDVFLDIANINFNNPSAANLTSAILVAEYTKN
jgi:hypothetical protein